MKHRSPLLAATGGAVFFLASLVSRAAEIHLAQGTVVGEVTSTSAILQTRLTTTAGLVDGDVAGAAGVGRFELALTDSFAEAQQTPWATATAERDFIVRARVDGLKQATEYFYRTVYGTEVTKVQRGPTGRFRTLPGSTTAAPVNFILTSCLNYGFFQEGTRGQPGYQGEDRHLGYPALEPLLRLNPDFCIFDGDCVYYDHPVATRAQTLTQMRKKWHEQYGQPRFLQLFARVPTYWLKDDHDYRMNDSDPKGDYAPSHELGIATFREQAPIVEPADARAVTYRTHRVGRDLQLWLVEGRDYRSANRGPDGPEKTIWGAEQKAWLQRTLKESNATFKILVSPTPLIGPDDGRKRDNHVNPEGFRQEGDAFFAWLKENGIAPGQFYVICGDRHWKYHSRNPLGYDELTCGALNRENSRLGRAPGDSESTDPKALVKQIYTDQPASGGFLRVAVRPALEGQGARIEFTHHDDRGAVLYQHRQSSR